MCWQTAFRKCKDPAVWKEVVVDQGKLQLVRVTRGSQSPGGVSRGNNNKLLNQPPNTSGSTESRVSCHQVRETSRTKLSTPQGYALCSRTPCRLLRKHHLSNTDLSLFFSELEKAAHPDKINEGGKGGIIPANISPLLHPCPALRARGIPLA